MFILGKIRYCVCFLVVIKSYKDPVSRESKIKVSEPLHGIRVLYASENSKDWLVFTFVVSLSDLWISRIHIQ